LGGTAAAHGQPAPETAAPAKPFEYVGTKTCRACHDAQHTSWEKTKMGKAFASLAPGAGTEIRSKAGLDPETDYRKAGECLECHAVGFGRPGGYAAFDEKDTKAAREARNREGVGCECCHGPGSEYVKVFKQIAESGRKYKVEELYAAGLIRADQAACAACHNERSTGAKAGLKFDYDAAKTQDIHEHVPLKQREPS